MTSQNFLTLILILGLTLNAAAETTVEARQSRKLDEAKAQTKISDEARIVGEIVEQFGTRPIKADVFIGQAMDNMGAEQQSFFQKYLSDKTAMQGAVVIERLSSTKISILVGSDSVTLEPVSIAEGRYRINNQIFEYQKTEPADTVNARLRGLLSSKSASLHGIVFQLLIAPAHAIDFSAMLGPILQLMMQQMAQKQQASADCNAINTANQFCNSVTNSEDPQRVSGYGLDNAIQMAQPLVTKSWPAATFEQCGGQVQQLATCVNLAQFQKQYGGWKPCSNPRQQGGGYVVTAFTIPCPAGYPGSQQMTPMQSIAQTAITGQPIQFRQQTRLADVPASLSPLRPRVTGLQ